MDINSIETAKNLFSDYECAKYMLREMERYHSEKRTGVVLKAVDDVGRFPENLLMFDNGEAFHLLMETVILQARNKLVEIEAKIKQL